MVNSNAKGKRGELWWVHQMKAVGFKDAHRGQQYKGTPDSPDVICSLLPIQWEVKNGYERLSVPRVLDKLTSECTEGNIPVGVWRRTRKRALVFLWADDFLDLLCRAYPDRMSS